MNAAAKTILVVEDNELNMKLFHDLLEVQGYGILQSGNGDEAFQLALDHIPDLILRDIQLPERSGTEVARQMKSEPKLADVPIIAITAFAMKDDEERIRASGCDDYLAKPISVTEFLEKVKRYLT
ncbi:MAG: response regulator [Pseudomonadota bacterium]